MTSPLSLQLQKDLRDAVDRHGLVVWQDDDREYSTVAAAVSPSNATFFAFEGSWMDLRHRFEGALAAASPPAVVIYVPGPTPMQDPIAEARAAGFEFRHPLKDLIKSALRTHAAESQIETIAATATNFADAETMAAAGNGDVSLAAVLGPGTSSQLIARVLTGGFDDVLEERKAWGEFSRMLQRELGLVSEGTGPALLEKVARLLLLATLDEAGAISDRLKAALPPRDDAQRASALTVVDEWWSVSPTTARRSMRHAEDGLSISSDLAWVSGLRGVDGLISVDRSAELACLDMLEAGRAAEVVDVANERLRGRLALTAISFPDVDAEIPARWKAVRALAELHHDIAECAPPGPASKSGEILHWYSTTGWRVDRSHRRLELALTALGEYGELEEVISTSRQRYEAWLAQAIKRYTSAVERDGFGLGGLAHQTEIHPKHVANFDGVVAYIWVDALRFEFAAELADSLRQAGHTVDVTAAVAAVPTITPVGMAALCPGSSESFALDERDGALRVTVQGAPVASVADRVALMRGAHGVVVDFELGECVQKGEKSLSKDLEGANAVLVRSQELDTAGENGLLSAQWSAFDELTQTIPRVVSKLGKAGVTRVVITADHGFIALSRRLGDAYKIDAPQGGSGELHRRAWIGRGATNHPAVLRLPLGSTGATTDADLSILVPRELALFKAGGSKQFFHGGLSPQELIVPVLVAEIAQSKPTGSAKVDVDVVGGKISTAMFAASLVFSGDLFTKSVRVRLVARKGKDISVARVSAGDGYDESTGTVTLDEGNANPRLMFQVTKALDPADDLELQVVDASTDVMLGKVKVKVAAPIRTAHDDLDD